MFELVSFVGTSINLLYYVLESSFAVFKYHSTKYTQATMKEDTLITIVLANVNHLDLQLGDYRATVEEKKALKAQRKEDGLEYDIAFMQKHFNCSSYDELKYTL